MDDFLNRFGTMQPDGKLGFSNVREGLIVAMLSIGTLLGTFLSVGEGKPEGKGLRDQVHWSVVMLRIGWDDDEL